MEYCGTCIINVFHTLEAFISDLHIQSTYYSISKYSSVRVHTHTTISTHHHRPTSLNHCLPLPLVILSVTTGCLGHLFQLHHTCLVFLCDNTTSEQQNTAILKPCAYAFFFFFLSHITNLLLHVSVVPRLKSVSDDGSEGVTRREVGRYRGSVGVEESPGRL